MNNFDSRKLGYSTPRKSRKHNCPDCSGPVYMVHRRAIDQLISLFVPVRRYKCFSPTCAWEGNKLNVYTAKPVPAKAADAVSPAPATGAYAWLLVDSEFEDSRRWFVRRYGMTQDAMLAKLMRDERGQTRGWSDAGQPQVGGALVTMLANWVRRILPGHAWAGSRTLTH